MSTTISNNHDHIHAKLDYFIASKKIPNIIFHGASGSGKRTMLNTFLEKIYENDREKMKKHIMCVECSHGKGIKFIREDLKFFAKSHIQSNHGANFKSIVLLNADSLTIDAQSALRRCIELFSHNTRFFIAVENKERLLNPILSRFCEIYVSPYVGNPVGVDVVDSMSLELYNIICEKYHTNTDTVRSATQERSGRTLFGRISNNIPENDVGVCRNIRNVSHQQLTTESTFGADSSFDIIRVSAIQGLIHDSITWCERGYSALQWIECVKYHAKTRNDGAPNKCMIVLCYHKIKPDFRSEKLLVYYVMYFTLISSNEDLENILVF